MTDGPVLVLHEGWGRTGDMDHVVDRLASLGLTAIAPDLFASRPAWRAGPMAVATLSTGSGEVFDRADLVFRTHQPSAVLGLSLGAAIALRRSWPVPVVAAYGHVPRRVSAKGPILGVYGTADRLLASSGRRLARLDRADVRWFEGAGHSFLAVTGVPSLGKAVGPHPIAEEAWKVIAGFLQIAEVL